MVDIVAGDATGSLDLVSPRRARASGVVSGLAIGGSAATRVLVTFGDSITEGAGATPGKAMSWPAQLGRMLVADPRGRCRSEEHTSELQSLMRTSYAVFCLKKKKAR